jgi:hypothetical protein
VGIDKAWHDECSRIEGDYFYICTTFLSQDVLDCGWVDMVDDPVDGTDRRNIDETIFERLEKRRCLWVYDGSIVDPSTGQHV